MLKKKVLLKIMPLIIEIYTKALELSNVELRKI